MPLQAGKPIIFIQIFGGKINIERMSNKQTSEYILKEKLHQNALLVFVKLCDNIVTLHLFNHFYKTTVVTQITLIQDELPFTFTLGQITSR